MPGPVVAISILLVLGIAVLACRDTMWAGLKLGESWAVAALVTVLVALFTLGTVL